MTHCVISWLEIINAKSLDEAKQIAEDCLLLAGVAIRSSPPQQNYHAQAARVRANAKAAV